MFTNDITDESKVLVNPIQYSPGRLAIYAINKCEDQVIGFEFVSKKYQSNPHCCGTTIVNLCVPIEVANTLKIESAEFLATNDACYTDWIVKKVTNPAIELQKNLAQEVTGIIVRFFKDDTCCYPVNMAFKLYGLDKLNCKYLLSSGLLIFR